MSTEIVSTGAGTPADSELLIATFADENTAGQALATLKQAQATGVKFSDAAVVRREDDGSISIKETADVSTASGAVAGALIGGLLGLLTGKKVAGAGLGALLGAGAAHMVDAGIPDARLKELAASLPNGSSALAVVFDADNHDALSAVIAPLGGTITTELFKGGVSVSVPKTGIESIDNATQQAAEAIAPYAGQAAAGLSSAQSSAEEMAKQAASSAQETWSNVSAQASDVAQQVSGAASDAIDNLSSGSPSAPST